MANPAYGKPRPMTIRIKMPPSNLIKVVRWNIRCLENGHAAVTHVLAGDSYGRQLGVTPLSEHAIIDAWIDPVYNEVAEMVHQMLGRTSGISDCVLLALSVTCDPAPSGHTYDFSGKMWCPVCGSSNVEYGPDEPLQFSMMSIPMVTHDAWTALTEDQRHGLVYERLQTGGCLKP